MFCVRSTRLEYELSYDSTVIRRTRLERRHHVATERTTAERSRKRFRPASGAANQLTHLLRQVGQLISIAY